MWPFSINRAGRVYYPLYEYALSKYSLGYVSFDEGTELFAHDLTSAPTLLEREKKAIKLPGDKKITLYLGPADSENYRSIYKTKADSSLAGFKKDSSFYSPARVLAKPQDLFKAWA